MNIRPEGGPPTESCSACGSGALAANQYFGPGYRIYFGREGHQLIILLGGGTKHQQNKDVEVAKCRWQDYKKRKD